jgi:carbon monoxide dehydrogenase subunit G
MKLGAKIFGALSGVLLLYLVLGILLPGTWEAEVTADLSAPPATVFDFLDRAEEWVRWNALPESGAEFLGPDEETASGLVWDDPQYGKGSFSILTLDPPHHMQYEVSIEGGTLTIQGTILLTASGNATRLHWREEGDFGWNPLMGYAARGMTESQEAAMEASLNTLRDLLPKQEEGGGLVPPSS